MSNKLNIVQRATNSLVELIALYTLVVAITSSIFCLTEHVNLFDSIWWAVTTSTTTGYGDISPKSVIGKLDGMFLMIFSVFVMCPLIIAYLLGRVVHNPDAFTHDEQEEIKATLRYLKDKIG